jgi:hypothetical protein
MGFETIHARPCEQGEVRVERCAVAGIAWLFVLALRADARIALPGASSDDTPCRGETVP